MNVNVQPVPARLLCSESFAKHTQALGQVAKGKVHELALSPDLPRHHVWIAAGAYKQEAAGDNWKLTCSLRFFKGGGLVGEFPINTASEVRTFEQPMLVTLLATGSRQPVLRYQTNNELNLSSASTPDQRTADNAGRLAYSWNAPTAPTTWYVTFLDIPCFEIVCHADTVQYVVTEREPDSFSSDAVRLLTGLRILSMTL